MTTLSSGFRSVATWLRRDFAEWFVGSWALILGWLIFGVIFYNLLLMDGHFSRGLGEGSGVNPDRFQQIGWMYRLFAAVFLMLAVKLTISGLKGYALAVRIVGGFIATIVILHATGFGLKALEGKRDNANAIEAVATTTVTSNDTLINELKAQRTAVATNRDKRMESLQSSIGNITIDGLDNDDLADDYRIDQKAESEAARTKIDELNTKIESLTASGGTASVDAAGKLATNEEWAPLFVGLAQLITWNPAPTDWAIYVVAVIFIIFWVVVGDAIAILLPPALYRLHLQDAKAHKIIVAPDVFADLQAQADELARRKENLADGADRANITKGKKRNRKLSKQLLEDQRTEMAKQESDDRAFVDRAINEMSPEGDSEYEEFLRDNDEPEQPEAPPPVEAPAEPEPVAAAEEAPEPEPEEETADLFDKPSEEEQTDSELLLTQTAAGEYDEDEDPDREPELPAFGDEPPQEEKADESTALVEYKDQLPATIDDDLDMPGDERKPQAAE